jgi:hypothetical protein
MYHKWNEGCCIKFNVKLFNQGVSNTCEEGILAIIKQAHGSFGKGAHGGKTSKTLMKTIFMQ